MTWSVQYTDTDSLLTFLKSCLGPNMLVIAPYHRMMKAVARNDVCVFKINEMSVQCHIFLRMLLFVGAPVFEQYLIRYQYCFYIKHGTL